MMVVELVSGNDAGRVQCLTEVKVWLDDDKEAATTRTSGVKRVRRGTRGCKTTMDVDEYG